MSKNFGYEELGGDGFDSGKFFASRFVCPDAGILSSISGYIYNQGVVAHNIQLGIYNDDAGVLGTKLISSPTISVEPAFDGYKVALLIAYLVKGAAYWLCINSEDSTADLTIFFDAGEANTGVEKDDWTFGVWPDNPTGLSYDNYKISIFATYTEVEASPYNWGMMSKSQIDPETIESAILRLIAVHEADPTSHLDTGESLQSHKAQAIIDHVVGSVLADKLSHTEGIFELSFQSLDNIGTVGVVTLEEWPSIKIRGDFAAVAVAYIQTTLVHPDYWLNYAKNMLFQFFGWTTSATNCTYIAIIGEYVSSTDLRGFGFKIVNGVVYGFWGKDGATTLTAAIDIDESKPHVYRAYYDADLKSVKFYVDGVYYATIEDIGSPADSEPQLEFMTIKSVSGLGDFWLQKVTASREA